MFACGRLTRRGSGVAARRLTFAAIDVETTGLDPGTDRVCEIAVVVFDADGRVLDEYASLVDPGQPVRATDIHGITSGDVRGAPRFAEVAAEVAARTSGAVVVAHNLGFEDRFLAAEADRAGLVLPRLPALCTLATSRAQLDGASYRLNSVYRSFHGQWPAGQHTALGDCRALAQLLPEMLRQAPQPLSHTGPLPEARSSAGGHAPAPMVPRAIALRAGDNGWMGSLVRSWPRSRTRPPVDPGAVEDYRRALDAALSAGGITGERARRLEVLARRTGMDAIALDDEHRAAWYRAAGDDAHRPAAALPSRRRRRLVRMAACLGHPELAASLAEDMAAGVPTAPAAIPRSRHLRGWRVAIAGTSPMCASLAALVAEHGGRLAQRLTPSVRFVVTDTLDGDDPMLAQARHVGIEIKLARDAQREILACLHQAEARHRDREAAREQLRQQRAQRDAAFRHTWRPHELPA